MQNKLYLAFETYEKLLEKKPDYIPAYIQLGLLCLQVGVVARGIEYFRSALTCGPTPTERMFIESKIREKVRLVHRRGIGR